MDPFDAWHSQPGRCRRRAVQQADVPAAAAAVRGPQAGGPRGAAGPPPGPARPREASKPTRVKDKVCSKRCHRKLAVPRNDTKCLRAMKVSNRPPPGTVLCQETGTCRENRPFCIFCVIFLFFMFFAFRVLRIEDLCFVPPHLSLPGDFCQKILCVARGVAYGGSPGKAFAAMSESSTRRPEPTPGPAAAIVTQDGADLKSPSREAEGDSWGGSLGVVWRRLPSRAGIIFFYTKTPFISFFILLYISWFIFISFTCFSEDLCEQKALAGLDHHPPPGGRQVVGGSGPPSRCWGVPSLLGRFQKWQFCLPALCDGK